jgi:hypothetical protein
VAEGERIVAFTRGRQAIPADGYALAAAEFQQDLLAGLAVGDQVVLDLATTDSGRRRVRARSCAPERDLGSMAWILPIIPDKCSCRKA